MSSFWIWVDYPGGHASLGILLTLPCNTLVSISIRKWDNYAIAGKQTTQKLPFRLLELSNVVIEREEWHELPGIRSSKKIGSYARVLK